MLLFNVPLYPNLIELTLSVSTLFVNYINIKDYIMMDTEKTITFGIWGEMGVRSSVKANIMSVKINDFPLPPIREGVSKCTHPLFLCTKPRLSQARALLFPKVFVPLGIQKFSL